MKPTVLCGWNPDHFAEAIRKESELITATSEESLLTGVSKHPVQAIVLLAELTWSENEPSAFFGFEVLCRLRAEWGFTGPIAMASFMGEEWLRPQFPILDFPDQHPLVRLPAFPGDLRQAALNGKPADPFRMRDIISSYCDPRARILKLLTHGPGFRSLAQCQEALSEAERQLLIADQQTLSRYMASSAIPSGLAEQLGELMVELEKLTTLPNEEIFFLARKKLLDVIRA